MESLKLIQKIAVTALCRGVSASGTFAINVLLAWQLPTIAEYGSFAVCLTAVTALAIFSRFGFDVALLRYGGAAWHLGDAPAYRRAVGRAMAVVTCISLMVAAATAGGLQLWGVGWESAGLMQLLLLSLPFLALCYMVGAAFKAAQRPEAGAIFEIGGGSLLACLLFLGWEASGQELTLRTAAGLFCLAMASFACVGLVMLWGTVWRRDEPEGWQPVEPLTMRSYLFTAADFAIIAGAQVLGNWVGLFLLETWYSSTEAGAFSAAKRIAMLPLLLQNILVTIASPRLAGFHEQQDPGNLRKLVGKSALLLFVASFPLLLIIGLAAPWALALFGSEYSTAWPLLSILAVGQLLGAFTGISTSVLGMIGQQQLVRKLGIVSSIVGILLSVLLTYQFGAVGAAVAAASYATLQAGMVAVAAWRQLGFSAMPVVPPGLLRKVGF